MKAHHARCCVSSTKRKRVRTRARNRRVNDAGESRPMPVSAARLASPSRSGKLDRENRKTTSQDYVLARFIYRLPSPVSIAHDFRSNGTEIDRIGCPIWMIVECIVFQTILADRLWISPSLPAVNLQSEHLGCREIADFFSRESNIFLTSTNFLCYSTTFSIYRIASLILYCQLCNFNSHRHCLTRRRMTALNGRIMWIIATYC